VVDLYDGVCEGVGVNLLADEQRNWNKGRELDTYLAKALRQC
jgi:hypothetical protein